MANHEISICPALDYGLTLKFKNKIDEAMQESKILPSDRDNIALQISNSCTLKELDPAFTNSFMESDSVVSSCMLTSDSYYSHSESIFDTQFANDDSGPPLETVLLDKEHDNLTANQYYLSDAQISPVYSTSSPLIVRPRKRDINWGDTHSRNLYATNHRWSACCKDESNYFRICFDTEFSDDEEQFDHEDSVKSSWGRSRSNDQPSYIPPLEFIKPTISAPFLSMETQILVGEVKSENGYFFKKALSLLSIPRLQLIVNDILSQINDMNKKLIIFLPMRDELLLKKEANQKHLNELILQVHLRRMKSRPNRNYRLTESYPPDPKSGPTGRPILTTPKIFLKLPQATALNQTTSSKLKKYLFNMFSGKQPRTPCSPV